MNYKSSWRGEPAYSVSQRIVSNEEITNQLYILLLFYVLEEDKITALPYHHNDDNSLILDTCNVASASGLVYSTGEEIF
jgi:hypothetical protein